MSRNHPSAWVRRFAPLIRPDGCVLDLAAGTGCHTRFLLDRELRVVAVDRETEALQAIAGDRCEVHTIDLEAGPADAVLAAITRPYDGIVVTNYLYRPLFPWIAAALAPQGVLIYETFALGNERFRRPRNPDHLLRPGELLEVFGGLTVVAFEQGEVQSPGPAVRQRIAAIAGRLGRLPE
jgi:SAM-dependent methyltransferase